MSWPRPGRNSLAVAYNQIVFGRHVGDRICSISVRYSITSATVYMVISACAYYVGCNLIFFQRRHLRYIGLQQRPYIGPAHVGGGSLCVGATFVFWPKNSASSWGQKAAFSDRWLKVSDSEDFACSEV